MTVPASEVDAVRRRERAVRQPAQWATSAEALGDYAGALAWLEVLEVVTGRLDEALGSIRSRCLEVLAGDSPQDGHPGRHGRLGPELRSSEAFGSLSGGPEHGGGRPRGGIPAG
jgi:hypothetical protein